MFTDFLIGGLSACISRTICSPFELFRLQRQNSFIPNSTMRDVYRKEGLRYFWKGNGINCIRAFPQFAITNAVFEKSKEINDEIFENKHVSTFISGSIGGLTSMICIYPLETTRTFLSLQTNKNKYSGMTDVFRKANTKVLYRGMTVSLWGISSWSGILYSSYHLMNEHLKNQYFDIKVFSGCLSGLLALTITYPSDLLRRRLQLQGFDPTVPKYDGIVDACLKIKKTEGYRGFYRGMGANYIKTAPTFAVQFWCIEMFKTYKSDS